MPPRSTPSDAPLSPAVICRLLRREYGEARLNDRLPPLDELIATILSQNTTNANSSAAFDELRRRFPDWDAVRRAPVARIAAAIRTAGLSQQKAPRIRAILQQLHDERGSLSLDFLRNLPLAEAIATLRGFPGVGPKTAACVLLFACEMPVLPVDTHVHRVSGRLGMIGPQVSAEAAHELLARQTPARHVLEFHLQMIRHGRRVCLARRPRCADCVLLRFCPTGPRELATAGPRSV